MSQSSGIDIKKLQCAILTHHKDVVEQFHRKHGETLKKAKRHSLTLAGAAIIAAAAATYGHSAYLEHHKQQLLHKQVKEHQNLKAFLDQLGNLLKDKNTLTNGEEEVLAKALSDNFKMNLKVSLNGNRLNEIVGFMGAEQHLYRWAGDNLSKHDLQLSGIAPLQGAFKNFDDVDQEKYYVAVQLHELPGWNTNWPTLKPWYRYRKVFVYNPANQKGVVAVIGDAGPSKWTGKTFGGSPEIMKHLEMVDGAKKGKAIILFVDDPNDKIALGPSAPAVPSYLAEK